jgi:hypothetical protein
MGVVVLTVACIKWGDKYGPEYVERLARMVARHLKMPYRFVCFTEKSVDGIECLPLPSDLPSWWAKIGLFKPGLLDGDVLYFDLDVVLTDDISMIARLLTLSPGLWVRDDFSYSLINPRQDIDDKFRRYLGGKGTVNSSVMLWRGDVARKVWDDFTPAVMDEVHGDQNWISKTLWPDGIHLIPDGAVCSYKYHVLRGKPIASVVVYHGDPKPADLPAKHPLRLMWEAA